MANSQWVHLIEECVSKAGAHVIDLVMRGEHAHPAIDVFVDAEEGITAETCSKLSRDIKAAIDLHAPIRGPYTLTVSSPGIARPFKFPWQYRKHIGRLLEVKMGSESGVYGRMGKLLSVDEEGFSLEEIKKGEQVHINFVEVVEAKVKAPW